MVLKLNTEVLNGLCSADQLELLDAVDQLRLQGIDHYVSLPQIIVCGDQSSGKSSVLEAISGVPFPVRSNLCTCFPTELILRRSSREDVSVSIVPHDHEQLKRSETSNPTEFHKKLKGFEGLAELIESAKVAMGITMQGKSFSKDLLRIEISGPHHPHLTIVDLPGLVHSETKQQTAAEVELVRDVVQSYMKKTRSVILAVVSAKNDFANQIVLKLARATDPKGRRTMGVITKPDTLVPGSGSESMFLDLAENKEVEFGLGWHVLKNLDSEQVSGSSLLHQRNEEEKAFFSQGAWSRLSSDMLGVGELRKRLSEVLLRQIATELPSLIKEIDQELNVCEADLKELGKPRATAMEQKQLLIDIGEKFGLIVKDIRNGYYLGSFFSKADTTRGYQQRLRAVVQQLNRDFAYVMRRQGAARIIRSSAMGSSISSTPYISRDDFVQEVRNLLRRSRGIELPGRFNELIVTDLFQQQSTPWRKITLDHVVECWAAAEKTLRLIINAIADPSTGTQIIRQVIEPAMGQLKKEIISKANDLIDSHVVCHPMTYNGEYLEEVHRIQDKRRTEFNTGIIRRFFGLGDDDMTSVSLGHYNKYNMENLIAQLSKRQEADEEKLAASEAIDCMEAYYNVALKRMIDDVAIEVVERKLMAKLSDILSPTVVFKMPEDLVSAIAGESNKTRARRIQLSNQVDVLIKGSETCKRFARLRIDDESVVPDDSAAEDGGFQSEEPVQKHESPVKFWDGSEEEQAPKIKSEAEVPRNKKSKLKGKRWANGWAVAEAAAGEV
ncbi:dynamin family protein [Poronia punctata]|nr:dynamin family protein [Poronia punctata]